MEISIHQQATAEYQNTITNLFMEHGTALDEYKVKPAKDQEQVIENREARSPADLLWIVPWLRVGGGGACFFVWICCDTMQSRQKETYGIGSQHITQR